MHFGGNKWLPCFGLSTFFLIRFVQPLVTLSTLDGMHIAAAFDKKTAHKPQP